MYMYVCRRLTCCDHLEDARRPLLSNFVPTPARQSTVVHVRDRCVVQSGSVTFVREPGDRNFGQVTGVIECPMEGHDGGVSIHLAPQRYGLLLQGAVQLVLILHADGSI